MQIGERLRNARNAIGCTLEKVAEGTGIGQSSLCDFENGKREPRFSQLSRLAEFYRRPIDFFLSDSPVAEEVMLWRDPPAQSEQIKKTETEFRQLCEQYHRLELLMGESKDAGLPQAKGSREKFTFRNAARLAESFQTQFLPGEIPSSSLRQVLEERFLVKVFHLPFSGSAISFLSPQFGPAVLLNSGSTLWRRNFDLAHELFHLLTWSIFRPVSCEGCVATEQEEKLADAFASRLLLPTDAVTNRVDDLKDEKGEVGMEMLDEIAREFGVSLDALLWRLLYLYNKDVDEIQRLIQQGRKMKLMRPPRLSDRPDPLPERYWSLAVRALRDGKLSLIQFAKYTGLSYKQAQEYLTDRENLADEETSISVA
ncbi:MAG TPA: XRE family transcriptional regulator [Sedimentisphaerales bacterium]|nr:XRE family transcriptional regulator [Sedimentisphaerales bacterium]